MSAHDVQPVEISYFDIFYASLARNRERNALLAARRASRRRSHPTRNYYRERQAALRAVAREATLSDSRTPAR